MVFVTDIGFIFISKLVDVHHMLAVYIFKLLSPVQKDSYAAILFVLSMNQFFLSFLVPVVIELSSESKSIALLMVTHCI